MKKIRIWGIAIIVVLLLLTTLVVVGYNASFPMPDQKYIYNGFSGEWVIDNDEYIFLKGDSPQFIHKATNEKYDFNLNAYNKERIMPTFCYDENIFYMVFNDFGTQIGYQIKYYNEKFDDTNVVKKVFYEDEKEELFGLIEKNQTSPAEGLGNYVPTQFLVLGDKIYLYGNDIITEYSLRTKTEKTIFKGDLGNTSFSYFDGKIYFQSADFKLLRYSIDTGKTTIIKNINPLNFVISDKGIVFTDLNDDGNLCYYNFESRKKVCIGKDEMGGYDIENDDLYFITAEGKYYCYNLSTGKREYLLTGQPSSIIKKVKQRNEIYITIDGNNGAVENIPVKVPR